MILKHIYGIVFMITLQFSNIWEILLKDLPAECSTYSVIEDNTRSFDNHQVPTSKADDFHLKKGWYRIWEKYADSLKQGFDKTFVGKNSQVINFCGTVYAGALMGEHPTVDEGMVEMTVCFRSRICFFIGIRFCMCKSKKTIYVRNCTNHYIYWLSATGRRERYCTAKTSLATRTIIIQNTSYAVECRQYKTLRDGSRVWDKIGNVKTDNFQGWYRYSKYSGLELASQCTVNVNNISGLTQPCGAVFRGWMLHRHPTLAEGRVNRRICFSYAYECKCKFYSNIAVRNCGSFFVYRLRKPPMPGARYCGAVNDVKRRHLEKIKNICKMYKVVHDPDSLWSYTSPNVSKCDVNYYGNYRFGSKYTPWTIKENCNKTDMQVATHRCGTEYQGFMEGTHPTVSDGYVERIICFQEANAPCECRFTTIVGVQNCSSFYVYNLQGVNECKARFCMVANKSASIEIDPGKSPLDYIPVPDDKFFDMDFFF